jgi:hypothetical protein
MRTTIIWHDPKQLIVEYCAITADDRGVSLAGTALQMAEQRPLKAIYAIETDPQWRTREVTVQVETLAGVTSLRLTADGHGSWWRDGVALDDMKGCLDVDLGITPATNTLPIRRLDLPVGASAEIAAVWVRFPALDIQRLAQRYTRLTEDRYRYQSAAFMAELRVDAAGIVQEYSGYWQAVAQESE